MKTLVLRCIGALFLIAILHWLRTRPPEPNAPPLEDDRRTSLYEQPQVKQSKARYEASVQAYYFSLRREALELEALLERRQTERRHAMLQAAKGNPDLERAVASQAGLQQVPHYDGGSLAEPTWNDVRRIEQHLARLRAR